MEYFLGSAITLAITYVMINLFKTKIEDKKINIVFNQSHKHNMVKDYIPINMNRQPLNTQASKHLRSSMLRIIFMDNKAYWIKDNAVYVADIIDGNIEKDNAKVVDTYTMDDVQLKKIEFIVDKLTEGLANDSGNSGNK